MKTDQSILIEAAALPYAIEALEPIISRKTLEYHHGKHYRGYVKKLNKLLAESSTGQGGAGLTDLVRSSAAARGALFNNAAQAWNHGFYFQGLAPPDTNTSPETPVAEAIERSFGSLFALQAELIDKAAGHFGSGWAWLVRDADQMRTVATHDADSPLLGTQTPLWTIDVWEHAYYLDYQNQRKAHVEAVVKRLMDWRVIGKRWREVG